jgi:hypothetical protein
MSTPRRYACTTRTGRLVVIAGAVSSLLAGCGSDSRAQPVPNSPSQGASNGAPPTPPPARPPGGNGGSGASFSDVFGPPTGKFGGGGSAPSDTAPAETTPNEPAPPSTAVPSAPVETAPPAPADTAPRPQPSPVAALAPTLADFAAAWNETNTRLVNGKVVESAVPLDAAALVSKPSLALPGGSVSAVRLDGGVLGILQDTQGGVAGLVITGAPRSAAVVSAVVTSFAFLSTGDERKTVADAIDAAAVGTTKEPTVIPSADGGHWVIKSGDRTITVVKLQDNNPAWVLDNYILLSLDALVAIPPAG